MKKVISTFLFFIVVTLAHSQTTYYWVGGTNGAWATATSWNTALNGSGTSRSSNSSSDILIFDYGGSNNFTKYLKNLALILKNSFP